MENDKHLVSFKKTIFRLAASMTSLEIFHAVSKNIQRISFINSGSKWTDNGKVWLSDDTGFTFQVNGKNRTSNPFKDFENACRLAEDFINDIINEILINKKVATNLLNTPIANALVENEDGFQSESTKSGSCTRHISLSKRTSLRLPAELYSFVRTTVSKMLPHDMYMKTIAKLRDCFFRNDFDRFNYIFSEASKGRSIFQNIGKSTKIARAKNVLVIDAKAGQKLFLEQYGIASDAKCGLIFS